MVDPANCYILQIWQGILQDKNSLENSFWTAITSLLISVQIVSGLHWICFFSTLAHTFIRMSGAVVLASKYMSSTLDALRHSVISAGFVQLMVRDVRVR